MSDSYIEIMPDLLKALARYEESFDRYFDLSELEEEDVILENQYRMTLEDLQIAILHAMEKDLTVSEFCEEWYYPLLCLRESFGIDEACGSTQKRTDETWLGLPVSDEEVFSSAWDRLEDIWLRGSEECTADHEPLKEILKDIEVYLEHRDKPISEREYTDRQKEEYIGCFQSDRRVKAASEEELALCRKFTDELCTKDSQEALYLKGYACYGGNRLYACDWKASRDCVTRLYELTDNPTYANTLGYIYYYGRCTGGVPEYEKAFEMFTVSAANGIYEGIYKLGDMFRHGYACKQSPKTAARLYAMVYDDCYPKFLKGYDTAFADAALRMGNIYFRGIGTQKDPVMAYGYYLQADLAAKRRAGKSDFFGDTTVAVNIQKALEEARKEIPGSFFEDSIDMRYPQEFEDLTEQGYRVRLSIAKKEDDRYTIKAERIPKREEEAQPILIVYPAIDMCELSSSIELTAEELQASFDTEIRYDFCDWNIEENRIEFYYDEQMTGWISCHRYFLYRKLKDQPSGSILTLVSVEFQPNGRTYDYISDIPDIQIGDTVIVNGYDGETEVNIRVLFDANTNDDIYSVLRDELYRQTLKQSTGKRENKNNLNVALALIDDLAKHAPNETDEKQIRDNEEIIQLATEFDGQLEEGSLEWINLQIKKATACYNKAKLLYKSKDPEKTENAKTDISQAIGILKQLKEHEKVPKIWTKYFHYYLGLYCFWQYKMTDVEADLDESISYYNKDKESFEHDSRYLNCLAVSMENKVRLEKDPVKKISELEEVSTVYWKSIKANPQRDRGWRNVAAVNRDIIHTMLNIDLKNLNSSTIVQLDSDAKKKAEDLYSVAVDCIEKGSMLAPADIGFHYVLADLNCSMSLIRRDEPEEVERLLEDARKNMEIALLLGSNDTTVEMVNKYLAFCVDELIADPKRNEELKSVNKYHI